jgi:hypothetical protein
MGTRATITFQDKDDPNAITIYTQYDGYPQCPGMGQKLIETLFKAWRLPRYEADEFAAAFVAANKAEQGGIRILADTNPEAWAKWSGIEYRYLVRPGGKTGVLSIACWETDAEDKWKLHSSGPLLTWLRDQTACPIADPRRDTRVFQNHIDALDAYENGHPHPRTVKTPETQGA